MLCLGLLFLLVLLTQLDALGEEAVLLSAGEDVQYEGCCSNVALREGVSERAVEESESLILASAVGYDLEKTVYIFFFLCLSENAASLLLRN